MTLGVWVRSNLVTADAVYGLILYSVLIAGVSDDDDNAFEVLLYSGLSLLIFWGAHVFAGTVANHGAQVRFRDAVGQSIAHSSGMLYASILPSVPLIVATFGVLSTDDAVDLALLIAMIVLGVIGYNSFAQRKSPVIIRILGGIGTGLFGLLVILLNLFVH